MNDTTLFEDSFDQTTAMLRYRCSIAASLR